MIAPAKVLVLGGTGFVGRSLCTRLTSGTLAGRRVTVATRDQRAAAHLKGLPGLEVAQVDVFDPVRMGDLVRRHDAVVNLVAVLHGDAERFRHVHVELVRVLVESCRSAGKPRVIHVSALGVGDDAPSLYLRSKTEGEACLNAEGIDPTILRPSVIFGARDRFLNLFATLLKFAPVLPLAGAHALFQPVWVEDVAEGIVRCLDAPERPSRIMECVGPAVYELIELVRLVGRWSGHPRPVFPLPASLGRLQASVLERLPGEPMMSRDNLESMRTPNVASAQHPTLSELGIDPAALEMIGPTYL